MRRLGVVDVAAHVATGDPGVRGIRVERQRPIEQGEAVLDLAGKLRERVARHPERLGIVLADLRGADGRAAHPHRAPDRYGGTQFNNF